MEVDVGCARAVQAIRKLIRGRIPVLDGDDEILIRLAGLVAAVVTAFFTAVQRAQELGNIHLVEEGELNGIAERGFERRAGDGRRVAVAAERPDLRAIRRVAGEITRGLRRSARADHAVLILDLDDSGQLAAAALDGSNVGQLSL